MEKQEEQIKDYPPYLDYPLRSGRTDNWRAEEMTNQELTTEAARWRTAVELRALEVYGETNQVIQTMEECAELILALSHHRRQRTQESWDNVAGELADVGIMRDQMMLEYDCVGEVQAKTTEKLARLERRLNGEKQP